MQSDTVMEKGPTIFSSVHGLLPFGRIYRVVYISSHAFGVRLTQFDC